jgi:4-hydroxy-2-oxoheptanedioate aldolase
VFDNKLRKALDEGRVPIQAFVMSGSTMVTRAMAEAGFDSLLLDMQHGPTDRMHLFDQVAIAGVDSCPMVRVPSSEIGHIESAVEARVHGVIVPTVGTAEEAARTVELCKLSRFGDCMSVIQIESVKGYENMEEIYSVPGLDAVLPGPSDLSVSFGGPPGLDYETPISVERNRRIIDVAHEHGLKVGLVAPDRKSMDILLSWGVDWIVLLGDMAWIAQGGRAQTADVQAAVAAR